jgi:hypothetical protein
MHIVQRDRSQVRARRALDAIAKAGADKAVAGRVCSAACTTRCPQCGSASCACRCSPYCPDAPRALSAEPDRYPIEAGIVPLVFAMRRQGYFTPCWSCEGHLYTDGAIGKLPCVWFYSESTLHLRLLASGLHKLKHIGRLRASWQVAVTFSDVNNLDTTYALEPAQPLDPKLTLDDLRKDIVEIAAALQSMICEGARALHDQNQTAWG